MFLFHSSWNKATIIIVINIINIILYFMKSDKQNAFLVNQD